MILHGISLSDPVTLVFIPVTVPYLSAMADDSTDSSASTNKSPSLPPLEQLKALTQLPLRLTPANYFSWRIQFTSLFFGLDLMGYLDGSLPPPVERVSQGTTQVPNPEYTHWRRQDQLILHALTASITEPVIPLIGTVVSAHDAWSHLHRVFSKRSQSHIIHLKDKLSSINRGSMPVAEFLLKVKAIADELATLGAPPSDEDLLIYCTKGLGPAYKEVIAALRTRDTLVLFEELFDKLIDHETYLRDSDAISTPAPISVNYTYSQSPHRLISVSHAPPPTISFTPLHQIPVCCRLLPS